MMVRRVTGSVLGAVAVAASIEVATYPRWRNWCLTWGATEEEAKEPLPGDELLADPYVVTTRAVTVGAPPEAIWPWLVQMGPGRGGAYTYDWIENLFGLGMHSADRILPELQDLAVGSEMRLGRRGPVLRVEVLEPAHALVSRSDDGNWVWAFALIPDADDTGTRLISRNRIALPAARTALPRLFSTFAMEPGSLVMERKMLLGIRQRAEGGRARDE